MTRNLNPVAFIRPDFFGSTPHDDATKAAFMAIEERISQAFRPEDAFDAFTINGAYLPSQP